MSRPTFFGILACVLLLAGAGTLRGQTIRVDSISNLTSCDSLRFDIHYTTSGKFDAFNKFIVANVYGQSLDTFPSSLTGILHCTMPLYTWAIKIFSTIPWAVSPNFQLPPITSVSLGLWKEKTWIITGESVLFSSNMNDTTLAQVSWDFDTGAVPRYFSGHRSPPIYFQSPGKKHVRQTVTLNRQCTFVRMDTELYVQSTFPSLGSAPTIVYPPRKIIRYGRNVHILAGATLDTGKAFDNIFVDSGGTALISWPAGGTIYVKSGGTVLYTGSNGTMQTLVLEPGAIVTGNPNVLETVHRCTKLDFDSSHVIKPRIIGNLCAGGTATLRLNLPSTGYSGRIQFLDSNHEVLSEGGVGYGGPYDWPVGIPTRVGRAFGIQVSLNGTNDIYHSDSAITISLPKASIIVSSSSVSINDTLNLSVLPEIDTKYHWTFDAGTNQKSSDLPDPPAITFSTNGLHRITLLAQTSAGCSQTSQLNVIVASCTPNVHWARVLRDDITAAPGSSKVWVQKWGELHSRNGETVFADSGAEVYVERGSPLIYAKSGSVTYVSSKDPCVMIVESGASIRPSADAQLHIKNCTSIAFDTSFTLLQVEGVLASAAVEVFPNPASAELHIRVHSGAISSWVMYDVLGAEVLRKEHPHPNDEGIETSMLAPGCYILHLNTTKGSIERRFIRK